MSEKNQIVSNPPYFIRKVCISTREMIRLAVLTFSVAISWDGWGRILFFANDTPKKKKWLYHHSVNKVKGEYDVGHIVLTLLGQKICFHKSNCW